MFPFFWILIGQFKFPARQPYARNGARMVKSKNMNAWYLRRPMDIVWKKLTLSPLPCYRLAVEKFHPRLIFIATKDTVTSLTYMKWSTLMMSITLYVMERPEVCKDLFDVIHDWDNVERPLTEREARRYFAQIQQANINCEETGVLHQHIKPENILVDICTDEAKLIDFELVCEVQQELFTKCRGENNAGVSCVRHLQVK